MVNVCTSFSLLASVHHVDVYEAASSVVALRRKCNALLRTGKCPHSLRGGRFRLPFVHHWNLIERAPGRIIAAVSAQPSGVDPKYPNSFYKNNIAKWGALLCKRRPEFTLEMVGKFLSKMYGYADFVITASRDFVRNCQTALLVLPGDVMAHPYVTAMEMVHLAPNAQVSLYPWKETKENVALAVRHVRSFSQGELPAELKAN